MDTVKYYHSSIPYAIFGKMLKISFAVPGKHKDPLDDVGNTWLRVSSAMGATAIPMIAESEVALAECSYVVYSAVIPGAFTAVDGNVEYSVEYDGAPLFAEAVEVKKADKLPELIITEVYGRPRGLMASQYIELTNTTDEKLDLYDYKLMYHKNYTFDSDTAVKENYFCANHGECVLEAHESCVVRFLNPSAHKAGDGAYVTSEGFCEIMNSEVGYEELELSPDKVKIFNPEISVKDDKAALGKIEWKLMPGAFDIPSDTAKHTLLVVPKEGGFADSIYTVYLNTVEFDWDLPVRDSSIWNIDIFNSRIALNIAHRAEVTPGYLAPGQLLPDFADTQPPLIIPETPVKYTYQSDGAITLKAAVVDSFPINVFFGYKTPAGKFSEIPAQKGEDGLYFAVVPAEDIRRLEKLEYYIKASDSIRSVCFASQDAPQTIYLYDNVGPELYGLSPANGFYCEDSDNDGKITVKGKYRDVSGMKLSKCILCIDKKNVTAGVAWSSEGFEYTTPSRLRNGRHTIEIALFDNLGNKSYYSSFFIKGTTESLNCYHGEVHCHTRESDGCGLPVHAIKYARDVGGVDFFAVTDHSHYITDAQYEKQIKTANEFNAPGKFATIYGWEMTWNIKNGYWGHLNVLNTDWCVHSIENVSMPELFKRVQADPDVVAMFNHPCYAWGNFDEFNCYSEEIAEKICLSEIKSEAFDREYMNLLANKWHATPAYNEDNHSPNWTTATPSTTYVLSPSLTRENILDSMKKRRTYSTSDPSMKIYYKVNGQWLGSTLNAPDMINAEVKVSTESVDGIGTISLVAEDNITVATIDVGARQSYTWKVSVLPEFDYYYIKITSGGMYTVTAPVWVEGRNKLNVRSLDCGISVYVDKPAYITAEIANESDKIMSDVKADFYLSKVTGIDYERAEPYKTIYLGKLKPGEQATAKIPVPYNVSDRLSVVAKGFSASDKGIGKALYADTKFIMLTPLLISSILPKSHAITVESGTDSERTIDNPFAYITLQNLTHNELSLVGYSLRLWIKTGKAPSDATTQSLSGQKIAPRSTFVIWLRGGNTELGTDDFNKRYGTSFTVGNGFMITDKTLLTANREGRRLELMCGNKVVSRVHYNYALRVIDGDVKEDTEIMYKYVPNMTSTSEIYEMRTDPVPGKLANEQKPTEHLTGIFEPSAGKIKKSESGYAKISRKASPAGKRISKKLMLATLGGAAFGAAVALATAVAVIGKKTDSDKSTESSESPLPLVAPTALAVSSVMPSLVKPAGAKTKVKTGIEEKGRKIVVTTDVKSKQTFKKTKEKKESVGSGKGDKNVIINCNGKKATVVSNKKSSDKKPGKSDIKKTASALKKAEKIIKKPNGKAPVEPVKMPNSPNLQNSPKVPEAKNIPAEKNK
ncbi:MAG: hypothetical protein MR471_04865 [Clostridia bacterium]|nr:hypothetical protein [Clostridia bacterium]